LNRLTPQNAPVIEIAKQSENHLVQGPSIPENEVDASFDEAFLEIMPELIVKKSVLGAKEAAAPERCHVTADPYGNSLCTYSSRFRSWCCILMKEMRERTSGLPCLLKRNIISLHKKFSYTLKLMFFATKPGASIWTDALLGVRCVEFAVSFHTIVVAFRPCP